MFLNLNKVEIKLSVIRQKGESQNGGHRKTKHTKISEKLTFLTPWDCKVFSNFLLITETHLRPSETGRMKFFLQKYCVKSVQIRSFFWSVFSRIRTRKNPVYEQFSSSEIVNNF